MGITVLPCTGGCWASLRGLCGGASPSGSLAERSLCLTPVSPFPCAVVLPGSGGWSLGHMTPAAVESSGL